MKNLLYRMIQQIFIYDYLLLNSLFAIKFSLK